MKKLLIFLTLSFLTLNACENVFEITPQDKISETDVWTDPILVRSFMNAIYTQTFGQGLYRDTQLGGATDEIHSIKNAGNYYIIQRGELTSDNISSIHAYLNNWPSVYKLIRETNIFFSKIQAATFDEITKNQMIAEMKFINAFLYAKLIERYGGVPIITQVFGLGENDYSLTRDSYDDCVNHIVNQLDEVINALPKKQTGTSLGKISADAARALKARVLLYAASPLFNPTNDLLKWQKAADAAKVLINNGYSLHNNYQQLFMQDNNEIIFARFFTQANFHQINVQAGRNGNDGYGSDTPTQNLIDGYEMAATGELPFLESGEINVTSGYDPSNPYAGRDPRLYASILYDGSMWMNRETQTWTGGMDSRTGPIAAWNGTMSGYYLKKFVPEDIPPMGSTLRATNPWIMFRYAEVLLNYAEANYELGKEDSARFYINLVRARPGISMPPVTATGEDLKKKIQQERRIELAFEGHRYFDVRRWKIADVTESKDINGVTITKLDDDSKTYAPVNLVTRKWYDKQYLLPIPQTEIDRSLGSLVQNPDYD